MSAVIYLYFPAAPTERKNFTKCWAVFVSKSTSLFCSYAVYLFPNGYLLSTYTGGQQSCQILVSLTVVRHQWVHKRWWDQIHSCRAAFSEVFSLGPTLPCGDQWGNTTIRWCAPGFGKPKISVGLLLSSVKLGPNSVVTLHLYFALKDPKLFIVTCIVLWGVFGWVSSKDKAMHLSHLTVNKDTFNNVQSRENEQAGTCTHILGALSSPGSLENSHLTVVLLWP